MAGAFPTLSVGGSVFYPLTMRVLTLTRVYESPSGARQRHAVRAPMVEFTMNLSKLVAADAAAVDAFFDSQKGAFDSTWTLTFNSRTFTGMRFAADEIRWTEDLPGRYSATLSASGMYTLPATVAALPALASGAVTRLGWSKARKFETSFTDMESGSRHALALRGGGFTAYPSTPALSWKLEYRGVTEALAFEVADRFATANGRYAGFSFTDPDDATVYSDVHFAVDVLEVNFRGYANASVTVEMEKV